MREPRKNVARIFNQPLSSCFYASLASRFLLTFDASYSSGNITDSSPFSFGASVPPYFFLPLLRPAHLSSSFTVPAIVCHAAALHPCGSPPWYRAMGFGHLLVIFSPFVPAAHPFRYVVILDNIL